MTDTLTDGCYQEHYLPRFVVYFGSLFSGYHGTEGPWKISKFSTTPTLQEMYLNASIELGQKVLRDINSAEQEGNFSYSYQMFAVFFPKSSTVEKRLLNPHRCASLLS